ARSRQESDGSQLPGGGMKVTFQSAGQMEGASGPVTAATASSAKQPAGGQRPRSTPWRNGSTFNTRYNFHKGADRAAGGSTRTRSAAEQKAGKDALRRISRAAKGLVANSGTEDPFEVALLPADAADHASAIDDDSADTANGKAGGRNP